MANHTQNKTEAKKQVTTLFEQCYREIMLQGPAGMNRAQMKLMYKWQSWHEMYKKEKKRDDMADALLEMLESLRQQFIQDTSLAVGNVLTGLGFDPGLRNCGVACVKGILLARVKVSQTVQTSTITKKRQKVKEVDDVDMAFDIVIWRRVSFVTEDDNRNNNQNEDKQNARHQYSSTYAKQIALIIPALLIEIQIKLGKQTSIDLVRVEQQHPTPFTVKSREVGMSILALCCHILKDAVKYECTFTTPHKKLALPLHRFHPHFLSTTTTKSNNVETSTAITVIQDDGVIDLTETTVDHVVQQLRRLPCCPPNDDVTRLKESCDD